MHVVVIGSGIVGAASAVEVLDAGHEVSIVEPGEPGGRQAASYGNSGWISPASIIPMSTPGLWRKVPSYLADPTGPLALRWRHLPRLTPWLIRFVLAGFTVAKLERTAHVLSQLLGDAPERHVELAARIGRPDLIRRQGLIYAYRDRAAFEEEALSWRVRRDNGVAFRELDGAALHALEPALSPEYTFAAFVEGGAHCVDPGGYVNAVAQHALTRGARHVRTAATGFDIEGGRLRGVVTEQGTIACERAVIAAGIHSKRLAALAGDRIPLESERGYHVVLPQEAVAAAMPVMPVDGRMGNNPTLHGLRVAGQVELASTHAPADWERAEILLRHARRIYPALAANPQGEAADRWMGHRPSTPDGLPVIGRASASGDIVHAFGHGHVGLASGPASGRLVAGLIAGKDAPLAGALSPRRFRLAGT